MNKYIYFLLLQISTISAHGQNWNLVWSDEFSGNTILSSDWVFETGTGSGGWGNNELQYYTTRKENVALNNGNLLIIAKKESFQNSSYTSARMKTQGLHSWTYGKIESRIKMPTGKGIWPAFWMLGSNINQVSWPACGEIDIMEHVNTTPEMNGTIHWNNNGHVQYGGTANVDASQYHTYSIEWNKSAIKWLLDGKQYVEANIANNINSTEEFHSPFFIILNLAVGGTWPGNPDGTTLFPDTMYVDYVRVYQDGITANEEMEISTGLTIQQNSATGTSEINYTLNKRSLVQLHICDVLGRKLLQVFDGEQTFGLHQLSVNTSTLPSGIYYLRASFNGLEVYRKFIKD